MDKPYLVLGLSPSIIFYKAHNSSSNDTAQVFDSPQLEMHRLYPNKTNEEGGVCLFLFLLWFWAMGPTTETNVNDKNFSSLLKFLLNKRSADQLIGDATLALLGGAIHGGVHGG